MPLEDGLQPGQNPRDALPRHRERGPKRFQYTVYDVARVAEVSVSTVYRYVDDVGSLEEVVAFICQRKALRATGRQRKPKSKPSD